ncbi:MAG: HlyD family efflux transporter periplasmic adaptor subunit [Acidobacteria bacterium]|nr:HlyD family efflux transporter periplasmic adaptor subunit [Acidobacteriota bacterium]
MRTAALAPLLLAGGLAAACAPNAPADRVRASGQVEATQVAVAPTVGGRLIELRVKEGDRVEAGTVVARLETTDTELQLKRADAERAQAVAQLRLLEEGARPEDVRLAEAQLAGARAEIAAAGAEQAAAQADVERFESLLASSSGSRKQRDDAVTRHEVADSRLQAARARARGAEAALARIRAGARPQEIAAAEARVAAAEAQIATLQKAIADAVVSAQTGGIVSETLVEPGEIVPPRGAIAIVTDLDRAWAYVYVDEPSVPRLRIGQPATVFTDAGGRGIQGTISVIAERAEFTPRNVQTAEDRSKLVYRVKIAVDNTSGVLKPGMPVEAEIPLAG